MSDSAASVRAAPNQRLFLGAVVLPDRIEHSGGVLCEGATIVAAGPVNDVRPRAMSGVDTIVVDGFIAPGFVDMHVHGGAGADFMDGTEEAFRRVVVAHARHGTTSIVPTTTVASHARILRVLALCRQFVGSVVERGGRVLGAHFYGPYFFPDARGCHPASALRPPQPREAAEYLEFADAIVTATVAPELPGSEEFVRACRLLDVRCNAGHSHATFDQMRAAIEWGVRHVDHLYCAMSDKSKLRQRRPFPMQGGVLEATLYFDELTTEVIADGKHLSADLLALALKIKGPDRLALVTDCNRALDLPDGRYRFGSDDDEGEWFERRDGVGVTLDGSALASGVQGMDHMVRTFARLTGRPLWEVVRMASLTPARIMGCDDRLGSLQAGKLADLALLSPDLAIRQVYVGGRLVHDE